MSIIILPPFGADYPKVSLSVIIFIISKIMQEKFSNYENFLNTFRVLLTKYREKYINYNILYTLYIMKSKEQTAVFAVSYSKDVIA